MTQVLSPALSNRALPAKSIRILLVEDEQSHAEIIRRAFRRDSRHPSLDVASTLAEATQLIQTCNFDLVITDWRLPDGDGIDLLLRGAYRLPFLVMTSHGNEQTAVDAMRAGAMDYVVKSDSSLMEMPRTADRALRLWSSQIAEEKLRIAEEKLLARGREEECFRLMVEGAPCAMVMVTSAGMVRMVNSETEILFGYRRSELLGRPVDILVPERLRRGGSAQLLAALHVDAATPGFQLFGARKDGVEIPIEMGLSVIFGNDGAFTVASIIDITLRKQAQDRLELVEKRFRRLMDVSPVGIVETNWEGKVLRANTSFYQMIGWDPAEFAEQGQDLRRITPEPFLTARDADIREIRESKRSGLYEKEYCRRDGSRVPVMVGLTVSDADPDYLIAVVLDLSEQKEAERRLRESEREIRLLADAMPQIVWTAHPDGRSDYYNLRWYEFTGFSSDENWRKIVHPDDMQSCLNAWNSSVSSGLPYETQLRFFDRSRNSYRWHLDRALPLRDESGAIVKWVGTCTDIDDHKRLSEELEARVAARTAELERSLLEKTTLLQEVHHRVKNNLQVVCSLLSMQVGYSDKAMAAPLEVAHQRVLAMALIHEQLYQSNTLSDVNFGAYVATLCRQLLSAYSIDPSRISLQLNVEPIPLPIGDAIPCGLILNELFSNALKHAFKQGPRGAIGVSFRRLGDRVELIVSDNGAGLPPDFAIEKTRSLGLKVVQTLARQVRGDLRIASEGGTAFALSLPVSLPAALPVALPA